MNIRVQIIKTEKRKKSIKSKKSEVYSLKSPQNWKTLLTGNEARHKRDQITWFHLYKV